MSSHLPIVIVVSGPSGAGKSTILQRALVEIPHLRFSVSHTTRPPRPGEREGIDYHFVTRDEFLRLAVAEKFLESAEVHGNLYGTRRSEVERVLASGKHVVMDIDVQGAVQFKRAFPQTVTIFILPPSGEVLLDRLRARKTESPAQLAARLQSALQELQQVGEYEYVIVNDDLERAVASVESIVDAEVVSRERVKNLRQQVGLLIERLEQEIVNNTPES